MLKILRQKGLAKKIFWVIIGVMVIAFVFWGAGAYRQGAKTSSYAGEIFGRKIAVSDFNRLYSYHINKLRLSLGDNYQQVLPYLNVREQVWTQLIFLEHARALKLKVSDQEIVQAIADIPLFVKDGVFNQETYKNVVRYFFNATPRDFEEQTRNDLMLKKLYEVLTKSILINDEEITATYKSEHEALSIRYLKTDAKDFLSQAHSSDAELNDYYQKNAGKFRRQLSVKIEYAGIDYPPEAQDADRLELFEHLKTIYPNLKASNSLQDAVNSPFTYHQTDFFSIDEPALEVKDEFYRYAFSLAEKETSPIIQTPEGAYVLRLIQKKPTYIPSLEEIKDKVTETLKMEKAQALAKNKGEEYKKKIDELITLQPALSLKDIASLLKTELKTTPEFKRNQPIEGIAMSQKITEAAFTLKPKEISGLIEADSSFFIIEQEKMVDIDQEKFKQEKESYREKLLERKKQNAFNTLSQAIIEKATPKDYTAFDSSQ